MKKLKRDIVGALIVSSDEKILLGKHNMDCSYPGTWVIPGGGVEEGENKLESLAREVFEETKINIGKLKPKLISDDQTGTSIKIKNGETVAVDMKFFNYLIELPKRCDEYAIEFEADEYSDMKWFEKEELSFLSLSEPSLVLFKRLKLI